VAGGGVIGVLNTGLPERKSANTGIPDLKIQNTITGMDNYDHAVGHIPDYREKIGNTGISE
jgi:hypothetical protein